jgi:hypothetical protein
VITLLGTDILSHRGACVFAIGKVVGHPAPNAKARSTAEPGRRRP